MNIQVGQLIEFSYVLRFSALPTGNYTGWHIRCDIRNKLGELVYDFGLIPIEPQVDGTGLAYLVAPTTDWEVGSYLDSDVVVIDNNSKPVQRSNPFKVYVEKGVTNFTTGT